MDEAPRHPTKPFVIGLVVFFCTFLLVTAAAVLTTIHRQPLFSADHAPPNGTIGSAQPGTIGMARPHTPLHVQ